MNKPTKIWPKFRFEVMYRPGHNLGDKEITELVRNLHQVGQSCFDELPTYQVFKGPREAFSDKVLALAWDGETLVGFCSELILKVDGIGEVLHLGLTCIRPQLRHLTRPRCNSTGPKCSSPILTSGIGIGFLRFFKQTGHAWTLPLHVEGSQGFPSF